MISARQLTRQAFGCSKRIVSQATRGEARLLLPSINVAQTLTRSYSIRPTAPIALAVRNWQQLARRSYSVIEEEESAPVIEFTKMKEIATNQDPSYVIVDVREPDEYKTGHIPGALNIPCKSSPGAYGVEAGEFESTFGFAKPAQDKTLVFYCLGGVRSTISEELASTSEYPKRLNYKGSWEDWVANRGPIEYPKEATDAAAKESPETAEPAKGTETPEPEKKA